MHNTIVFIVLIVCLAGFGQGLTGFGFGLIAMPLLPVFMTLREAAALTVLLNLVVCGIMFLSTRVHYSWRQGLSVVLGACAGLPAGVYMLVALKEIVLLRILGGVMLALAGNELLLAQTKSVPLSPRLGFPFGLLSGGLSGAFNMGGPPAVAYCYSQAWGKDQVVAVLQVVFGISAILRVLLFSGAGILTWPIFFLGLWSVLPLIGAILLGRRLFARVPQPKLRKAVFVFLGVMGIRYLVFP